VPADPGTHTEEAATRTAQCWRTVHDRDVIPSGVPCLAVPDDAELAHLLHHHVDDLFTWLDDYPADQVDPTAVASVRRSLDWLIGQTPVEPGDRLASLKTAAGLLVDLMWWLDTCEDEQVDSFVAVKLQEATGAWLDELTADQRRRLVEVLAELAASEQHNGRRYEIRVFAFALGLANNEIEGEVPPVREWIRPEDRIS